MACGNEGITTVIARARKNKNTPNPIAGDLPRKFGSRKPGAFHQRRRRILRERRMFERAYMFGQENRRGMHTFSLPRSWQPA
jgi:hypothetical protein